MTRSHSRPATHGPRAVLLDDEELFVRIIATDRLMAGWKKV